MNYEHGWARPDDPERAREQVHTREHSNGREAPERLDSREALHAFVAQGIEDGVIEDRAGLVAALEGAGLEVPRQGRDYVTALDPETGDRFRLKGEVYAEGWTRAAFLERGLERAEQAERAAERAAGEEAERGDGRDATPCLEHAAGHGTEHATPTLAEKLARKASEERAETEAIYRSELSKLGESLRSRVRDRARFHAERYPRSVQADHGHDGPDRAAAEAHDALDRLGSDRDGLVRLAGAVGGERVDERVPGAGADAAGRDQGRDRGAEPAARDHPEPDGWAGRSCRTGPGRSTRSCRRDRRRATGAGTGAA